jgi:PAS domain S-box-containing protein
MFSEPSHSVRASSEAVIVVDEQNRIIEATRSACDLMGYTREDLLARSLDDIAASSEAVEASRLLEKLQPEATIALETRLRVKDGSVEPFHLRLSRSSVAGRRHSLVQVARRRRAADKLSDDREFIRALLDSAGSLLLVLDREGRIAFFNKACEEATGFPFREVRGKRIWELAPEADESARLQAVLAELDRGRVPLRIEASWKTKPGRILRISWSTTLLHGADGSVRHVIATGIEAAAGEDRLREQALSIESERRRVEESLKESVGRFHRFAEAAEDLIIRYRIERKNVEAEVRRLNQGLERRVEERTEQLAQAVREMGAFTHTIAHDLRAPLRAMSGFSQAIIDDYGGQMDPKCLEFARRVIGSAWKMDALIRDLLSYGGLIHVDVQCQPVDLDSLVPAVMDGMAPEIVQRDAVIRLDQPLGHVQACPSMLAQVVSNLISNGIKFVAPGTTPLVLVRTERRDRQIRLWIEDNGIGIAPEFQGRIFGVFERLHREEDYPGTGIGLAIVRKAVERMGGQSGVESKPGQGSRFWVELPEAVPVPT